MPSMQSIFDQITSRLLGDTPATSPYYHRVLVGSKNLSSNIGSPLIVLVPIGAEHFVQPTIAGQDNNPQIIQEKDVTFTAHCWGKDYDSAEYLADAVLTALKDGTMGRAAIDGEDWAEGGHDVAGVALIRHFKVVMMEIPRIALPLTAPIETQEYQEVELKSPITLDDPTQDSDGMGTNINLTVDTTP